MTTTIPPNFGYGNAGLTRGSKTPTLETLLNSLNTDIVANLAAITALQTGAATGVKEPVRCATVVNGTLATAFAAGQAVDGVTLVADDRILLKDQSTGAENGIYTVNASGAPTRATDFDADAEVIAGCIVSAAEGTVNKDTTWQLTTDDPITVGTTAMVFELLAPELGPGALAPVRAATTVNGTLATAFAAGQAIDGVTLATGDRILLKNQTSGDENGVYVAQASGAPARASDLNADEKVLAGCLVPVSEGTVNADTVWQLTTNAAITLDTTALVFELASPIRYVAPETVSSSGAISVATLLTNLDSSGGALAMTLADGSYEEQRKIIRAETVGNDQVITPATFHDGTTITLATAEEYVELVWYGGAGGWNLVHGVGHVIA